jgi:hypothetical protein
MKDLLLIGIVIFVLVALFGDGGLTISPELDAALDLSPQLDVNYAPDRSVTTTTIEQQIVGDYVERQTVIVQQGQAPATSGTIAEGRPGGECFTVPGDVVTMAGGNGECFVLNGGQKYFIAPTGVRSWLGAETTDAQPAAPAVTNDGRLSAQVPLDEITTQQLQDAFTRNGGELPFGFRLWTDKSKRDYLASRVQTWQ